jgi:hypothetical protein
LTIKLDCLFKVSLQVSFIGTLSENVGCERHFVGPAHLPEIGVTQKYVEMVSHGFADEGRQTEQ